MRKVQWKKEHVRTTVWFLAVLTAAYTIHHGVEGIVSNPRPIEKRIEETIFWKTFGSFYPVMEYPQRNESASVGERILGGSCYAFFPLSGYVQEQMTENAYATQMENQLAEEELAQILSREAADENHVDENGNVIAAEGSVSQDETQMAEHVLERFQNQGSTTQAGSQSIVNNGVPEQAAVGQEYRADMLNYDFLINHFYVVDSTTTVTQQQLDAAKLLEKDMTMKQDNSKPQILIYHTHSQEAFVDSKEGDTSTTIVGMGDYLARLLNEKYGYDVIHNTATYDLIDGKLDRNKAYTLALEGINKILEENPSIEVVIDLHRDGIDGDKMVTDINGKQTAKIMFFNGLSYTNKNGAISYLTNPYIEDNLAFSLQLQLQAAKYYPGATRKIYLKGYRYNLHVRPKSLLVESGSQKNTVEEELNAMEVLADILDKVLSPTQ